MPPRLAHKKSKNGCQRCRSRKVKCDEIRPLCGSCRRHNVSCDYSGPAAPDNFLLTPTTSYNSTPNEATPSPTSNFVLLDGTCPVSSATIDQPPEVSGRRMLELQLFHQYMAFTAHTLPGSDNPRIRKTWAIDIPEMAFKYPVLLDTLLAVSALHIAWAITTSASTGESPSRHCCRSANDKLQYAISILTTDSYTSNWANHHRRHLDLAVSEQRTTVSQLGPDNADVICLTSLLIWLQSFTVFSECSENVAYTLPLQWFRLGKATATTIKATRSIMCESSAVNDIITVLSMTTDQSSKLPLEKYSPLLSWKWSEERPDRERQIAYQDTLCLIANVYHRFGEDVGEKLEEGFQWEIYYHFLRISQSISEQFLYMLDEGRPRALAIIAHLFAIIKRTEHIWWLSGIAEREVHGIQGLLPDEWQWALELPLITIRSDLSTSEEFDV